MDQPGAPEGDGAAPAGPPAAFDPRNPDAPGDPDEPYSYREISAVGGFGREVAFSPDSKRLAVACEREIRVLTIPDGREVIRIPNPDQLGGYVLGFAPDGRHLLSAGPGRGVEPQHLRPADRKLCWWSLSDGTRVKAVDLPNADDVLHAIGFSPDGRVLAIHTFDGISLVDTSSAKVLIELKGAGLLGEPRHARMVRAGDPRLWFGGGGGFSPDGGRFAAAAPDGPLAVWDAATGRRLAAGAEPLHKPEQATFIAFSLDGQRIATASGDLSSESIRIWDAATLEVLSRPGSKTACERLAWLPDGSAVVAMAYHRPLSATTAAVDARTGKVVRHFSPWADDPAEETQGWQGYSPALTPDGKYLVLHGHPSRSRHKQTNDLGESIYLCRMPGR